MSCIKIFLFYLTFVICVNISTTLIAYDCGRPSMNITSLNALHIKKCETPIPDPVSTKTMIQLLQIKEFNNVLVQQCKIEISRTIFYCGMHSHVSAVNYGSLDYIHEVTKEECFKIFHTRAFSFGKGWHDNLNLNGTNMRPATFAGSVSNDGYCVGRSYSDFYGSWENVVAYGQIKITLHEYVAAVNLNNNEVILRSGVRCDYSKGGCLDTEGGNTYWDKAKEHNCDFNSYNVLYEGTAERIKDRSFEKYGREIYSVDYKDITFAMEVKGLEQYCGFKLIKTEHPKLFIIDSPDKNFFTKQKLLNPKDMDIFAYINSKLVFLEKHIRKQITSLYNDFITQQCETRSEILKTQIMIQPPDYFAYLYMKKTGYMSHHAGETIYITKCIPVEVSVRTVNECYEELPVLRGTEKMFMTPITRILVTHGNQKECNKILAPKYFVNDKWMKLNPQIIKAETPNEISSNINSKWVYESPRNLAAGGIYSSQDLNNLHEAMMFPMEKPALVNTAIREMSGQPSINYGLKVNPLIDELDLNEKISKTWDKFYNIFTKVGNVSAALMGIWIVIRGVKFIVDTLYFGDSLPSSDLNGDLSLILLSPLESSAL